ncbi:MAG: FAD-dependent oxidoreductase, partial [Thermoplasmata archaeon]
MKRYELVILGGGAAAFSAAIRASSLGAKTLMINSGELGGTCVNVGCIPSKHILSVADALHKMNNPQFDSITPQSTVTVDFDKLIKGKDELVLSLREKKYAQVLEQLVNVDYLKGKGRFLSSEEVSVNGQNIEGKRFIIATGSSTSVPPIDGIENVDYLTNIEALSLEGQPESMIVIGGRALGLEFAQMYQRLGTKVMLLQRSPRILPEHEPEISQQLEGYLKEEGMDVHTGLQILSVKRKGGTKIVRVKTSEGEKEFEGESLLLATGRTPNTPGLNLQTTGVEVKKGFVKTNLEMRTSVPTIFAAGDVVGTPMLETVAGKEGYIAAENAIKGTGMKIDYSSVPRAVFTDPAVASVGLTDA